MNANLSDPHDHTALSQLWILRLLRLDRVRRSFVRAHDFRDDDLARFLDLHEWIDTEPKDFDPHEVGQLLNAKLAQLEAENPQPPAICLENCNMLRGKIGLNPSERDFMLALILFEQESAFNDAFNMVDIKQRRDFVFAAATMLKVSVDRVLTPEFTA